MTRPLGQFSHIYISCGRSFMRARGVTSLYLCKWVNGNRLAAPFLRDPQACGFLMTIAVLSG